MSNLATTLAMIFLTGSIEVLLAVGVSGVIEALFPPFSPDTSPWVNVLQGTIELVAYLLVLAACTEEIGSMLAPMGMSGVPYGSLLMPVLLENGLAKINNFVTYIVYRANQRRQRMADALVAPANAAPASTPVTTA